MNKWLYRTLAVIMILSATACGVKGPLYFPQEEPTQTETQ
ncbi:LPS translocon maturation chaperone LptM [Chelonobacter oris]|nr:lipoprotein [Chelonobacter oris]